jgi:hypothetical protein
MNTDTLTQLPSWFNSEWRSLMEETMTEPKEILRASVLAAYRETTTLEGGVEYVGTFHGRDRDRLTLIVSDMHYSIGAMHYYARVQFPGLIWQQVGSEYYTSRKGLRRCLREMNVTGPLCAKEKIRDPERYKAWEAGEQYPGFLTPQEAYGAALKWISDYTEGFRIEVEADEAYKLVPVCPVTR